MTHRSADEKFLRMLKMVLPPAAFRAVEPRYLEEPRGRMNGVAGVVVAPETTWEVSQAVIAAQDAGVPIIPYGGGTGLVGGQIMPSAPAPMILSLERMNKIRSVHPEDNAIIVEAGVILSDVHEAAESVGRLFGLTTAAKGSARIGGILATNAGGVGVLRYGNARDLCLGLEAVLPNGKIWNGLYRLRKNNMGYDLRNLLIGSEGTLGVITAAVLKLHPRPAGVGTALLAVANPAAGLQVLLRAQDQLAEGISGFEVIHRNSIEFLIDTGLLSRSPLDPTPEWMVLVEVGLARGIDPQVALETLFSEAAEADLVTDGVIAQSEGQRRALWEIRENIPEANRRTGAISSHDISLPLGSVAEFITRATAKLGEMGDHRINCFGHMGDGNLHFNVFPPKGDDIADYLDQSGDVKTALHDLSHSMGGSVSAEHGIGRFKLYDLERYGDPVGLETMRAIKRTLDPGNIMNPGAVLRMD